MSRGRRIVFVFGALFLGFALSEGAARVVLWIGGDAYSRVATLEAIEAAVQSYRDELRTDATVESTASTNSDDTGASSDLERTPATAGVRRAGERATLPHPYYGFERNTKKFHRVIAALLEDPAPKEYRIVVFGGSVAAGFFNAARAEFEQALEQTNALRGRDVVFVKYAHAGFKQPQQAAALGFLLTLGVSIDGVLELDGFNEVALGATNSEAGAHPLFPSVSQWSAGLPVTSDPEVLDALLEMRAAERRAERSAALSKRLGLARSAIFGKIALAVQQDARRRWVGAHERRQRWLTTRATGRLGVTSGPPRTELERKSALERIPRPAAAPYELSWREDVDRIVRGWFEASRSMAAMCEARGIAYLHVLQPTLHDPGSKPLTESERAAAASGAWVAATEYGYPRLREAGRRLDELGVPFFDASGVFRDVSDTVYYDHCHFDADGHRILAERIAPVFADRARQVRENRREH